MNVVTDAINSLPDYDSALKAILSVTPSVYVEQVPLAEAVHRTLQKDVICDRDQPPFERSAMDGYAIIVNGERRTLTENEVFKVTGDLPAGKVLDSEANTEQVASAAITIATGAPVPLPFNAVIPREQVKEAGDGQVTFDIDGVNGWANIHRRASDAHEGQVLLKAGIRLKPHHLGILAAVGISQVQVARKPRVAILTTGDEVYPLDTLTEALSAAGIRNSNGPMIRAMLENWGAEIVHQAHVSDDPEHVRLAAREALSHAQLVVTTGGISAGDRDYLPWAWKQLGMRQVLHGIAIQPGKPVFVAADVTSESFAEPGNQTSAEDGDKAEKLVIGLPGNPVSSQATASLFVQSVLKLMLGEQPQLPWVMVKLAAPAKCKPKRQLFRAARLVDSAEAHVPTERIVNLVPWHGSGDLVHTALSDGWVRLPRQSEPLPAGSQVPFLPIQA